MMTSSTSSGSIRRADRFLDHMAGDGRAMGVVEGAAEGLADRRAGGGGDDRFSAHDGSPKCFVCFRSRPLSLP